MKFTVGQRVRTATATGLQGPYGSGVPQGALGTVTDIHKDVRGHAYGYGVMLDQYACPCCSTGKSVFFYTFELEESPECT